MTLTRRMTLGFAALIAAVAVLVSVNGTELLWIRATEQRIDELEQQANDANRMMALVNSLDKEISYVREAVTQGAAVSQLEESFGTDAAALSSLLDAAVQSADPESAEASSLESMRGLLSQYQDAADTLFAMAAQRPDITEPLSTASSLGMQLGEAAAPYAEDSMSQLDAQQARLGSIATVCLVITSVLGSIAFFGGVALSWALSRRTKRTLRSAVSDIGDSTQELLTAASQASASAAQTAASTSETTATVEEVKQAAALSHEKATAIADSADGVARISEKGHTMVHGTNDSIMEIRSKMDLVSETVEILNERAHAVDDIIVALEDLAEQSNLLSVNASIEAAKAGESGKGFTVVAQEVKSLAEQSKQATARARAILVEIQKAGDTAVNATADSRDTIEMGMRQSLETGEIIQTLADRALEVAHAQTQIAASSRQQLAGMEQIVAAIESINQASDHSVKGSRQVDQATRHLQGIALRLQRLIEAGAKG